MPGFAAGSLDPYVPAREAATGEDPSNLMGLVLIGRQTFLFPRALGYKIKALESQEEDSLPISPSWTITLVCGGETDDAALADVEE